MSSLVRVRRVDLRLLSITCVQRW